MDRTESLGKSFEKINVEREKAAVAVKTAILNELQAGLTTARAELARNATAVLQKTADEAKSHAPTAYKFWAWAVQGALILSVWWVAYGAGVYSAAGKFYVENYEGIKTKIFDLNGVEVAGVPVSKLSVDGSSIMFFPADKSISAASKGWLKKKLEIRQSCCDGAGWVDFRGNCSGCIYI
jgi:hypothetical protein